MHFTVVSYQDEFYNNTSIYIIYTIHMASKSSVKKLCLQNTCGPWIKEYFDPNYIGPARWENGLQEIRIIWAMRT